MFCFSLQNVKQESQTIGSRVSDVEGQLQQEQREKEGLIRQLQGASEERDKLLEQLREVYSEKEKIERQLKDTKDVLDQNVETAQKREEEHKKEKFAIPKL